jgi:hypothetical protein
MDTVHDYEISGVQVRRLMRKQGVTIRALAQKYNLTMKRVRELREAGARGFAANELHYLISGVWLDGLPSPELLAKKS